MDKLLADICVVIVIHTYQLSLGSVFWYVDGSPREHLIRINHLIALLAHVHGQAAHSFPIRLDLLL